jgi:heme-degrading monooxygenase HmoA
MIARIWVGTVPKAKSDAYLDYLEQTGLREYGDVPGHLATYVLHRTAGETVTFTIVTHWDSMDAIRAFAGDDPERAKYYPEDDDFLLFREPHVEHHEIIWTDTT